MVVNDLKQVDLYNHYIICNSLERHNLKLEDMIEQLSFFQNLVNKFGVTYDYLLKLIDYHCITTREMFDYSVSSNRALCKVADNALYREKWSSSERKMIKTYYNVYLVQHEYIKVLEPKFINSIMAHQFSRFFADDIFIKMVRRFPKGIVIKPNLPIKQIDFDTLLEGLTCQDVADLINNPSCVNEMKMESKVKHYGNSADFYIELPSFMYNNKEYQRSLAIPYKALYDKDWSLVEDKHIYSMPYVNKNGDLVFYEGLQKDAPFSSLQMVKEIKKLFERTIVRG